MRKDGLSKGNNKWTYIKFKSCKADDERVKNEKEGLSKDNIRWALVGRCQC